MLLLLYKTKSKMANTFFKKVQLFYLALIFKFNVVNIHGITVLDAHFLQTLEQADLAQLHVEMITGFIVVDVDVLHKAL